MSDPATSPDTCSVTSLPESLGGPSPWRLPDGRLIDPCGLAAALVSLSASQVREMGLQISGISGLHGSTSSASAALQSSLENRLRQRLGTNGSMECVLTWKARSTASGRQYCQLVPSARPIGEIVYGLWPTPTVQDSEQAGGKGCIASGKRGHSLHSMTATLWPTPAARDWRSESASAEFYKRWAANPKGKTLPMTVALWATPTVGQPGGTPEQFLARKAALKGKCGVSLTDLRMQVETALWPTPTSLAPSKDGNNEAGNSAGLVAIRGHAMAGSTATTEKPGALNPQFVCWLMGYPAAWDACAPTATPSSRKSRRNSSKPTPKLVG